MDQGIHASKRSKKRIVELQDQPLSIRRRKERVKLPRRNEQNISRVKSDGFAVCFHGIFIFDRMNDFKRGVPVERKILRVPVDKGAHAGHAPVGDRFMRAVQSFDQKNHLGYGQFFSFFSITSGRRRRNDGSIKKKLHKQRKAYICKKV